MTDGNAAVGAMGKHSTSLGVLTIVAGILVMLAPTLAGVSLVLMVGALVLVAGAARMFWAFRAASIGGGIWRLLIGFLTVLGGIALLANPVLGSGVLTILLAIYLIVDGIAEVGAGVGLRPARGSGWMIFGGVLSILLGLLLWQQTPLAGAWAIGILLGIKLLMAGFLMLNVGSTLRAGGR